MKKFIVLFLTIVALQVAKAQDYSLVSNGRDSADHTILNTVTVSAAKKIVTIKPANGKSYTYTAYDIVKDDRRIAYLISANHFFVFILDPTDIKKKKITRIDEIFPIGEGYPRMIKYYPGN